MEQTTPHKKIKQFKTLKEFERQLPQRLAEDGTIPLTTDEILYYYHRILGVDRPRGRLMSFKGYTIVEVMV